VFEFVAPDHGVEFNTCASDFDTYVSVVKKGDLTSSVVGWNDESFLAGKTTETRPCAARPASDHQNQASLWLMSSKHRGNVAVRPGDTYWLVVDGTSKGAEGAFEVTMVCPGPPTLRPSAAPRPTAAPTLSLCATLFSSDEDSPCRTCDVAGAESDACRADAYLFCARDPNRAALLPGCGPVAPQPGATKTLQEAVAEHATCLLLYAPPAGSGDDEDHGSVPQLMGANAATPANAGGALPCDACLVHGSESDACRAAVWEFCLAASGAKPHGCQGVAPQPTTQPSAVPSTKQPITRAPTTRMPTTHSPTNQPTTQPTAW